MLERDIYKTVCGIILGYDRRRRSFESALNSIMSLAAPQTRLIADYSANGSGGGMQYSAKEISDKILELENKPSTKYIRAVEQAKSYLILKYDDAEGEKLFKALRFNVSDEFRYTYPVLRNTMDLYVSRATFFRIKGNFIKTVAEYLEIK